MSDPFHEQPFPRGALMAVAALVAFSLMAVTAARLAGVDAGEIPPPAPVESRDLRFEDRSGGLVHVRDAHTGALVAELEPATENFVRGVLRSLARERRAMELGTGGAMRLTRHADGRLTLEDTLTGRRLDLIAFGPTNYGSFARFLDTAACDPGGHRPAGGAGRSTKPAAGAMPCGEALAAGTPPGAG